MLLQPTKGLSEPLIAQPYEDDTYQQELKQGFFRKVFGIITTQLIYTAFICAVFMMSPSLQEFVRENIWVCLVTLLCGMICLLLAACVKSFRHEVPKNYINLWVFTTFIGLTVAFPCAICPPAMVITAGILTIAITVGCVVGAMRIKSDAYFCEMICWALLFDLVAMVVLMIIAPFGVQAAVVGFCALGVIIYALYIVIDVYLIFKGGKYGISHEGYVFAAMVIYWDIIQLFLEILRLLAQLNK